MNAREWLRQHAATLAALGCVALFVAQGCAFLDLVGVQHDEALFAGAILPPLEYTHSVRILGREIPLMLDSYLGCLKAWLYAPIFAVWKPDVYSLRVPVLLAAAFTVWLLYRLMRRAVGAWAALAACALLATDTMFVLTSVLDWGPVVLQHLLAVLVLWLVVRFQETGQRWRLALAAFCCGLAFWDKAAFAWTLAGFAAGATVVFRREVTKALSWRNALIAAVCLLVGAFPLIYANWGSTAGLMRASGGFSSAYGTEKLTMAWATLQGSSMFGYLTREDPPEQAVVPEATVDKVSLALSKALGGPWTHGLPWALAAAILAVPCLWRTPARRAMLFSLVALVATWLAMAVTARGGAASHHVVLLWPLPQMLVGTVAGQLASFRRHTGKAVAALLAAVCLSSLAVTNQYLADLVRNGNAVAWTDASNPLARFLARTAPSDVYVLDWGIVGPLRIAGGGRLPVRGWLPMEPGWEVREAAGHRALISSPRNFLVAHVAGSEVYPGRRQPLAAFAKTQGYSEHVRRVVRDRHGRPVFEVFYFVPAGQ